MPQDQKKLAVIDLEPLGGRKVTAEEFGQTVKNIVEQIQRLGKQPTPGDSVDNENTDASPQKPSLPTGEIKKYAIYAGSGLLGLWLIRKALK